MTGLYQGTPDGKLVPVWVPTSIDQQKLEMLRTINTNVVALIEVLGKQTDVLGKIMDNTRPRKHAGGPR